MSNAKEFRKIVGAIASMHYDERKSLINLLDCQPSKKWKATELLEDIAYHSADLNIAAVALKALRNEESKSSD